MAWPHSKGLEHVVLSDLDASLRARALHYLCAPNSSNRMSNIIAIKSEKDLKQVLATEYMKSIQNFFGDEQKALEFLSNVVASVQRNPKLLDCKPETLLNSFMVMASLKLMPSGVSGEAYVIPYKGEAQFQLGYQGLVTLFYRAGVKSIVAEIVRQHDTFSYLNGEVRHVPDVFSDNRGEAIGAYVIVTLQAGGVIAKVMSKKEIMAIGKKFSQSFSSEYSPWNEKNDPELWMWRKTVLKQAAKLVPKNETIFKALAEDNKDADLKEVKRNEIAGAIEASVDNYRTMLQACATVEALEHIQVVSCCPSPLLALDGSISHCVRCTRGHVPCREAQRMRQRRKP